MQNLRLKLLLVLAMLASTVSVPAQTLEAAPMPESKVEAMRANTAQYINLLSDAAGFPIKGNRKSVAWIDGFISKMKKEPSDVMINILGIVYGEALLAEYGGEWVIFDNEPSVGIEKGFIMFPISSVAKHFKNGSEDSILHLYDAVKPMLIEHRKK